MAKSIYKYTFTPDDMITIMMHDGAHVLSVQEQRGGLCMWALVDTAATRMARDFHVIGTGHAVPEDLGSFVATVQTNGGAFVWHIFDVKAGG